MPHRSEGSVPLDIVIIAPKNLSEVDLPKDCSKTIWMIVLPTFNPRQASVHSVIWQAQLEQFIQSMGVNSLLCILTSPQNAAETLPLLVPTLKLQLWVAVKLNPLGIEEPTHLTESHAALLILSRYAGSLRHTKTRIAYSYCPFCDKTSKDYGGKKHTYNAYGTLISDVWRDIICERESLPNDVIARLADMFGLEEYKQLQVIDLRKFEASRSQILELKKRRFGRMKFVPA